MCIVGAGVSGLRCADLLIQNGVRVTVLEARDRVGGRVGHTAASNMIIRYNNSDRFIKVIILGTLWTRQYILVFIFG